MKKIVGIIVIILMIPIVISIIGDIDRTPVYPTTEFNIEKLTRISSLDIENNIELSKLPNDVGDKWLPDGRIERKVGNVVLDGSESWIYHPAASGTNPTMPYFYIIFDTNVGTNIVDTNTAISNYLPQRAVYGNYTESNHRAFNIGYHEKQPPNILGVKLSIDELIPYGAIDGVSNSYIPAFKAYLAENPLIIYYQLATPTIENAPTLPEFIDFYDGGSVIIDNGVIDYTVVGNQAQINYIEGNITTVVDEQFKISKPTKIISKSNDLYDYDLSTLPNYLEYGSLPQGTYDNILEFINDNQNKQIKLFFNDNIQETRYNIYLENDTIIINNDTEVIRIYNDDTYTSTRNLDTDITYKLEGYNVIGYIDGEFDNTVLAFFWIIPVLLAGGLIYLLLKRKE